MTGPTSRRHRPIYLCIFSLLPAAFAVFGFLVWREDVVDRSSLKQVSGQLTALDFPAMGRARAEGLRIFLDDRSNDNRLYTAEQEVPLESLSALRTLRRGDQVTVLVRTYELSTISSLWELRRGSEVLLSYDQTRFCLRGEAVMMLLLTSFAATAAVGCLAAGLGWRWFTGSWG